MASLKHWSQTDQEITGLDGHVRLNLNWFSSYIKGRTFTISVFHRAQVLGPLLFSSHAFGTDYIQSHFCFRPNEMQRLSRLLHCLDVIRKWLTINCLQFSAVKTEFLVRQACVSDYADHWPSVLSCLLRPA